MYCRICGHSIQETDRFCSFCGSPAEGESSRDGLTVPEEVIYNAPAEHQNGETAPVYSPDLPLMFEDRDEIAAPPPAPPRKKEEQTGNLGISLSFADHCGESGSEEKEDEIRVPHDFSEFSWNVQDFPKPKKIEEEPIQWNETASAKESRGRSNRNSSEASEKSSVGSTGNGASRVTLRFEDPVELEPLAPAGQNETEERAGYGSSSRRPQTAPEMAGHVGFSTPGAASESNEAPDETKEEREARIRSLEQEIFAEAKPAPTPDMFDAKPAQGQQTQQISDDSMERYFTFSKKNEEFQKLLDEEYEKVQKSAGKGHSAEAPMQGHIGVPFLGQGDAAVRAGASKLPDLTDSQELFSIPELIRAAEGEAAKKSPGGELASENGFGLETASHLEVPEETDRDTKPYIRVKEAASPKVPAVAFEPPQTVAEGAGIAAGGSSDASGGVSPKKRPVGFESPQLDEMSAARSNFFGSTSGLNPEVIEEEEQVREAMQEDLSDAMERRTEQENSMGLEEPGFDDDPPYPAAGFHYEGPDRYEERRRLGTPGKVVIAVVIALLALEAGMLGIRYFAPQSSAAAFVERVQSGIIGIFAGGGEDSKENPPVVEMGELIRQQSGNNYNNNIKKIEANDQLKFNPQKDYGVEDINSSKPITDNYWMTVDGVRYNYDATVVGTVIGYNSMWTEYVNVGDITVFNSLKPGSEAYARAESFAQAGQIEERFNVLQLGEIRQGKSGFYIWVHEKITLTEDGQETEQENDVIYYMEPDNGAFHVIDYYPY